MLFTAASLFAQNKPALFADLQCLHSTHGNNFWGASIAADKNISKSFALGFGIEYTYSELHLDNDWILHNLNFLPIYTEQRLNFWHNHKANPFFHFEEGISFNKYDKTTLAAFPITETLHEQGLYLQAGAGIQWKLNAHHAILTELAIKSFKTTTNNLDVNPHGLTLKLGYSFH
jgi:hypothetical protein